MRFFRVIASMTAALFLLVGLVSPPASAQDPVNWACPATQPIDSLLGTFAVWGYDPAYMNNLCGVKHDAQPESSVKFSEADGVLVGSTSTGVIALPGAVAMDRQFAEVASILKANATKVAFANYVGLRWNEQSVASGVVAKVRDWLGQYNRVVVLGASTGGDVATKLATVLTPAEQARVALSGLNAPAGFNTLQPGVQSSVDTAMKVVPNPLIMWLSEVPWVRAFFFGLTNTSHYNYGSQFQLEQAAYNGTYVPLADGALAEFARVSYFASAGDKTVNGDAAYLVWQNMRGASVPRYNLPGDHVGWQKDPVAAAAWRDALATELGIINSSPLPPAA